MRSSSIPTTLLTLAATSLLRTATASWVPDLFHNLDFLPGIEKRCENPCGYYGQLCCASGQTCFTDGSGQAQCGPGGSVNQGQGGSGNWQYYTTTYVQTDLKTVTATFSSFVGVQATQAPTGLNCAYSQGETPCGSVCCHSGQYCQKSGSCMQVPGGSSGYYTGFYTVTTVVTNTAGVGIRPTTETIQTLTSTAATATTTFGPAVGANGTILTGGQDTGGGLSGGAIAGIVIGVIAGVILLFLLCACLCCKGLIDGLLGIFGIGRRRRRTEETYIEERHSHRGNKRTWWGQPVKTSRIDEKKKKDSGFGKGLGVAAFLGGLALILGLKRKRDDRGSSSYTGSSYSSYYDGSSSSPSSVTRSRSRSRSRMSRR